MSNFTELRDMAKGLLVGGSRLCKGLLKDCWGEEARCHSEVHYNFLKNIENEARVAGHKNVEMATTNLRQYLCGSDEQNDKTDKGAALPPSPDI